MKKILFILVGFTMLLPVYVLAQRSASDMDMQRLAYLVDVSNHKRISKILQHRIFNKEQLDCLYQRAKDCETQRGEESGRVNAMNDDTPVKYTHTAIVTSGVSIVAGVGSLGFAGALVVFDHMVSPLIGATVSLFPPLAFFTIGVTAVTCGSLELFNMLWPSLAPDKKELATQAYEDAQLVTHSILEKLKTL